MDAGKLSFRQILATILGVISVACSLLGVLAWAGYGSFASRGILTQDLAAARRLGSIAGTCSVAQLVLGLLAIVLGGITRALAEKANPARRMGKAALWIGGMELFLLSMLV
jgi:hypothetical protein